ncbi:MAG: hypothetical protein WB660_25460 [Candidatus Sulfotelmatobacter sp.]
MFRRTPLLLIALAAVLSLPAQDLSRRLILKDGSYQSVSQYEVKGDRVRYMSAERNEWEELPSSLVDWPATEKYEKDRATSAIPEASALGKDKDKETATDRETELARLPQVAPGLRLPEDSGIFLLDNFQGQPQLVEMQQTEVDINRNSKGNIFRGALNPVAGGKQTVELEGEHAAIHAHVAVPSIYINLEEESNLEPPPGETASAKPSQPSLDAPRSQQPQPPEQALTSDRFRIVQAKVKDGKRIVGDIKRAVSGKVTQDETFVKTTSNRITGGWLKLTPTQDLPPGEYAVVELKGSEGMNAYVWDFQVDPKAPANANPWKPEGESQDIKK